MGAAADRGYGLVDNASALPTGSTAKTAEAEAVTASIRSKEQQHSPRDPVPRCSRTVIKHPQIPPRRPLKKACGPRSRLGPTSPAREDAGFESKARLTLRDWCLSTRPPPAPRWCGSTVDVHGAFD